MKKTFLLSSALMFAMAISEAQTIPNSGFESWTNMGNYNNPDSWSCLNNMTSQMNSYTCTKGTPGNPGTAYLKLTSKTVSGMGVVPGIAVCGVLDTATKQAVSGFAFSTRPASFTGKWQHMIYGSSQGYIDVKLTRWDNNSQSRVIVAYAHNVLSGMAMSWANFTINLTYTDGNNPDSCMITMAASGTTPTNNDYLWVDNLAFTGTVTGMATTSLDNQFSFYPNPASDKLVLNTAAFKNQNVHIEILDVAGKKLITSKAGLSDETTIDISSLAKGNFILNMMTSEGTITRNFIKQ